LLRYKSTLADPNIPPPRSVRTPTPSHLTYPSRKPTPYPSPLASYHSITNPPSRFPSIHTIPSHITLASFYPASPGPYPSHPCDILPFYSKVRRAWDTSRPLGDTPDHPIDLTGQGADTSNPIIDLTEEAGPLRPHHPLSQSSSRPRLTRKPRFSNLRKSQIKHLHYPEPLHSIPIIKKKLPDSHTGFTAFIRYKDLEYPIDTHSVQLHWKGQVLDKLYLRLREPQRTRTGVVLVNSEIHPDATFIDPAIVSKHDAFVARACREKSRRQEKARRLRSPEV
jgi:hypothetical protein